MDLVGDDIRIMIYIDYRLATTYIASYQTMMSSSFGSGEIRSETEGIRGGERGWEKVHGR